MPALFTVEPHGVVWQMTSTIEARPRPGLDLDGVRSILADRQGFLDSICRERTSAGFVADTDSGEVRVCGAELPVGASVTRPVRCEPWLGLTLARAIADQHGGSLALENRREDGKVAGLRALLRLPI